MSTAPQLISCRQVIDAEQLHRARQPYDMLVHTQIRAEEELRAHARKHELALGPLSVRWECRVEAMTLPEATFADG